MAAEDWIDYSVYCDADYHIQYNEGGQEYRKSYTDHFSFNGRRLRTDKQKQIQEEITLSNYLEKTGAIRTGRKTGVSYDLQDLIGQEVIVHVTGEEKFPLITKEQVVANKFYISSPNVFVNNWGHPTLDETVKHAQDMLQKRKDINEIAIVEIVRVVRRKPIEVDIETV